MASKTIDKQFTMYYFSPSKITATVRYQSCQWTWLLQICTIYIYSMYICIMQYVWCSHTKEVAQTKHFHLAHLDSHNAEHSLLD